MLTIKLGVNSGMKFEKGIFSIIRSLMYLDGMVLKSNPDAVLMNDMRRFTEGYRKFIYSVTFQSSTVSLGETVCGDTHSINKF
jgi:hypothetical protein